jgi:deazaflavin-dependent oxidoreductase (nitroreductase family)
MHMHALIVAAVVLLAAVVVLAVVYRVLKAAHSRPPGTASPPSADAAHQHSGAAHQHSGLERVVLRAVTKTIRLMLRMGVRLGPMMMLTVRGRKTGVPRTNPVDLFGRDGRHWLVATHDAEANWVRNLRAAGEGTLARGRRRYTFTSAELPQIEAGTVLKEVLGPRLARPFAGFVLRQTLGVPPHAPLPEFIAAAERHPVFELAVRPAGAPAPTSDIHQPKAENATKAANATKAEETR